MRIRPITRDDVPEVVDINFQTFKDDGLYAWLFPHQDKYPDHLRKFHVLRLRNRLVGVNQLGLVALTEEGDQNWSGKEEVAGYAFFGRSGEDEAAKKWNADSWFNKLERYLLSWETWYDFKFLNRAFDPDRVKAYQAQGSAEFFKPLGSHWYLMILGVSPNHQRRGIGRTLVEHGQELAAKESVPLALESSIAGRKLYLNCGFKIVGERKVCDELSDMRMVWEPEGLRGTWLDKVDGDMATMKEK